MDGSRKRIVVRIALCLAAGAAWVQAAGGQGTGAAGAQPAAAIAGPGMDEHLGALVSLDARFTAEDGSTVLLKDLVDVPTFLMLAYYHCQNSCTLLLEGAAEAAQGMSGTPGKDYRLITISFDPSETAEMAAAQKAIALQIMGPGFPADGWRFLTGDREDISLLTGAVGFRYTPNGEDFDHPLGLIMLSPSGKIVRYINGTDFLPADIKISTMEASEGTVGPTVARLLRFCFSYDPESNTLAFNTLKVSAVVIITIVAIFVLYLVLSGRRRRMKGRPQ